MYLQYIYICEDSGELKTLAQKKTFRALQTQDIRSKH